MQKSYPRFRVGSKVRLAPGVRGHFNADEGVKRTGRIVGYGPVKGVRYYSVAFNAPKCEIMAHGYPHGYYTANELRKRKLRVK